MQAQNIERSVVRVDTKSKMLVNLPRPSQKTSGSRHIPISRSEDTRDSTWIGDNRISIPLEDFENFRIIV